MFEIHAKNQVIHATTLLEAEEVARQILSGEGSELVTILWLPGALA